VLLQERGGLQGAAQQGQQALVQTGQDLRRFTLEQQRAVGLEEHPLAGVAVLDAGRKQPGNRSRQGRVEGQEQGRQQFGRRR
jgi:hypothetical protein